MIQISPDQFERLVGSALDAIPPGLATLMDNVAVFIEDEHDTERDLLGLYDGIPLTERDSGYTGMVMPDRITIYRIPICWMCDTEQEVTEEVLITVIHEIAHHFGIDDDRLHELGWD